MASCLSDLVKYQRLFQMIFILGIGGSLQVGLQISMITYASVHVKKFINETWQERYGSPLHHETLMLLWSFIVSVFGIGGLLGSMGSGYLTRKYGKKKCLMCNNLLMLSAAFVMGFSKTAKSFEMILIGRLLCGISAAMKQFWGEGTHQAEIDDMMKEKATMKSTKILSVLELMKEASLRWQLYTIIIIIVTLQICGINTIYVYAFEVLHTAGFGEDIIPYMSLSVGLCELLSSILCSIVIEQLGRKRLLCGGYGIMALILAILTVTLTLQDWFFWMPYCSLCLILLYVIFFGIGPAGATISIRVEIFDQSSRPSAFVIGGALNWVGIFVIWMIFPFIVVSCRYVSLGNKGLLTPVPVFIIQRKTLSDGNAEELGGFAGARGWERAEGEMGRSWRGRSQWVQYQKLFPMIFVLGIGGTFSYGFQVSMISYPSMYIKNFINDTWQERYHSVIDEQTLILLWSFIVSTFSIGGFLGTINSRYLSAKYGKSVSTLRQRFNVDCVRASTCFLPLYFYAFDVFRTAGFTEDRIPYISLGAGICEFCASIMCSFIIDKFGRRMLLLWGYALMVLMLMVLTTTLSLQHQFFWMPYFSIALIFLLIIIFATGPAGASFPLMPELFTQSSRSSALVISMSLHWVGLYVIGMIFPYVVHIRTFINETWIERYGYPLHHETIMLLWSFIVSVYGIGGLLGSLYCGYLTTKYRKKKCQIVTNLIMLVASLFMAFCKMAKSFEMILIGRFLYGMGTGFSLTIHPQYVGEISPKKLRGFSNSTLAVFLTLGKVLGQIFGLRELLGNESLWPLLLASTGLTALIQLIMLPFFPDSPSYLLIQKGNEDAFMKAIKQLWGEGDHQEEIDDILKEKAATKSTKTLRVLELFKERSLRWQLYFSVTIMTSLQLSGVNAIYFYSFEVFRTARFEDDLIPYISLGVGTCECLSSIVCSSLIERFGRRMLLCGGYVLMIFVLTLLTMTLSLQESLGPFCYLIFLGILVFSSIFTYLFLPETKGKSIMEIKGEFNKLNFGKKPAVNTENNLSKEHTFCTKL
ncbi:Solute carrier family 2, facilitated glucose transporter member 11 [Chelonia mydas]|uniref:Solute carrier family 2, facilitated glucose transporter member 11 n=1 Tax=Chelonia mydas TaxID=8469 RepID=M7BVH5_CHEMY|nr:Solute carrier family 2, facilitated glucose transporter member 11 [Chelonia mydas]